MTDSPGLQPDRYLDSGAYAADALSPDEVAAFEAAMAADPALRDEAESLQATTARLGTAAAEPAPPGLRDRVMAQVDQTRQEAPPTSTAGVVVPLPSRRWSGAARLVGVAAAALLLVSLGMSAWVIGLRQQNTDLVAASSQVTRVITAPDARTISGPVDGQPGRGAVIFSPSLDSAVFVAEDLADAPSGQTYQLWFVGADGSARSAGTFSPSSDGTAAVALAGSPDTAAAVGMSLEPAGGSTQPTTTPVLALPLA